MSLSGTVLVTGGTGSFGHTIVRRLLAESNVEMIRVFSRDETKQDAMREEYYKKQGRRFQSYSNSTYAPQYNNSRQPRR